MQGCHLHQCHPCRQKRAPRYRFNFHKVMEQHQCHGSWSHGSPKHSCFQQLLTSHLEVTARLQDHLCISVYPILCLWLLKSHSEYWMACQQSRNLSACPSHCPVHFWSPMHTQDYSEPSRSLQDHPVIFQHPTCWFWIFRSPPSFLQGPHVCYSSLDWVWTVLATSWFIRSCCHHHRAMGRQSRYGEHSKIIWAYF